MSLPKPQAKQSDPGKVNRDDCEIEMVESHVIKFYQRTPRNFSAISAVVFWY